MSQESWPWNCESPKEVSRGCPRHFQIHVVRSRVLKCRVKSYVIRPSTKWYFTEFLFMWGSLHMIKKKNTMVSWFCVKLTFKRWFLKITQKTWNMIHLMACRNPCRLYVHCAFTYFVGPSSVMWSELGLAPPFPPMRVLEVQWSHALGLMCEVALGCPNHGIWPTHIGCVCVEGETVSKELLLRSNLIGLWSDF